MQEIPIVLIGHKDHGKSTLVGRLLLDTNSIKESKIQEIKETDEALGKKFELAHLVDAFKEEREKEMTMDTTRAFLRGNKRNYQLIDVPGHGELISNMLTGATSAEVALLVVDVTEGIKEQTRQHLEIAKLLGVEQLGIVINKMDKIDYQKEDFDRLVRKLKEVLNNIGYFSRNVNFFPISAWEGENVVKRFNKTYWYQGKTIMEFLEDELEEPESFDNQPLSFLVQDKSSEDSGGFIIGKVESGIMKVGEEVLILPVNEKSKIKSIKDSEGELKEAKAGENVGVELLDKIEANRGSVICSFNNNLSVSSELFGEMFWIERPSQSKVIVECGTAQVEGNLKEPEVILPGKKTSYRVLLKRPIAFEPRGKTILGKLVLKDKGKIIALGTFYL